MNIARLFSYTKELESQIVELKARILTLEDRLEKRTAYAFALTGRPTQEVVERRVAASASATAEASPEAVGAQPTPTPLKQRHSLRALRRDSVAQALARREPEDKQLGDVESIAPAMAARADEFAQKVKAG